MLTFYSFLSTVDFFSIYVKNFMLRDKKLGWKRAGVTETWIETKLQIWYDDIIKSEK